MPLDNTTTASNGVGSWFQPAGCVQATVDTATKMATYVFNACTGPLGLVELNGTVDVTWSDAPGQLTLNYAARASRSTGRRSTPGRPRPSSPRAAAPDT